MSAPRWLRGVLDGADRTTEVRLGHGPIDKSVSDTESVDAMMRNVELINQQLGWHASEVERLVGMRREMQDKIIEQLLPLGINGEVAK